MNKVSQIRSFNRSYTQILGLLNHQILDSALSLSEARIIYELAEQGDTNAKNLSLQLQIDKGYLSRMLKKLKKEGYILSIPSINDKRYQQLTLSPKGKALFSELDKASHQQIEGLLEGMSFYEQKRFIASLGQAQQILESQRNKISLDDIHIRNDFEPGDIGFIIQSHGELYHAEQNFSLTFEKYVASSLVDFFSIKQPNRSQAWICEHNHNKIGFLMLVDRDHTAQLRYFFIYPEYRGIGLGGKLMRLFMEHLKQQGFTSCFLLTSKELGAAQNLYLKHGFQLIEEKESAELGENMIEQKYILELN